MTDQIKARLVYDGGDEIHIPPEMGQPRADQLQGSVREQLSELAGRVCYDSLGSGRSSTEFHRHILDVGHLSVYEGCNFTVSYVPLSITDCLVDLINRPGIFTRVDFVNSRLVITANVRSVLDWNKWNNLACRDSGSLTSISSYLQKAVKIVCPTIYETRWPSYQYPEPFAGEIAFSPPLEDEEKWASLYLKMGRTACYDEETEVLTEDGWKFWKDVTKHDVLATLNADTEELEYQSPTSLHSSPYSGPMYYVTSSRVNLLVTPDHRLFARKYDTQKAKRREEQFAFYTPDQIHNKRVEYKRDAKWIGKDLEFVDIPDVPVTNKVGRELPSSKGHKFPAEVFAEFLGYWIAEGYLRGGNGAGYMAVLSQKHGTDVYYKIKTCLDKLGLPYTERKRQHDMCYFQISCRMSLYNYLFPLKGEPNKYIPKDVKQWSPRLLRILVEAYLDGDGSFTKGGGGEGNTVSKRLADDLQEVALKIGWSATIRIVDRRHLPSRLLQDRWIRHKHIGYVVSFGRRNHTPLVQPRKWPDSEGWTSYSGKVYCASVPNGTLYVRRNGRPVWSGNSHEQVRHRHRTAVSQRSSRYCDESGSSWVGHPLLSPVLASMPSTVSEGVSQMMSEIVAKSRHLYNELTYFCQSYLSAQGVDKLTARKQARGAARGYLGNSLQTEMIFSASVAQWRRMIEQRLTAAADAEIRCLFAQILTELQGSRYGDRFQDYKTVESPDGLGVVLQGD